MTPRKPASHGDSRQATLLLLLAFARVQRACMPCSKSRGAKQVFCKHSAPLAARPASLAPLAPAAHPARLHARLPRDPREAGQASCKRSKRVTRAAGARCAPTTAPACPATNPRGRAGRLRAHCRWLHARIIRGASARCAPSAPACAAGPTVRRASPARGARPGASPPARWAWAPRCRSLLRTWPPHGPPCSAHRHFPAAKPAVEGCQLPAPACAAHVRPHPQTRMLL